MPHSRRRPRAGPRRLRRRHARRRHDDARPRRVGLLGGDRRRLRSGRPRSRSGPTSTACSPRTRGSSTDVQVVPHLSFGEASELAYFGAKVLHPATILPAVARNIPVRILNSRRPQDARGTLITRERPGERPAADGDGASKRGVTVVDITSTRMLMAHGFLARIFERVRAAPHGGRRRHDVRGQRVGDRRRRAPVAGDRGEPARGRPT